MLQYFNNYDDHPGANLLKEGARYVRGRQQKLVVYCLPWEVLLLRALQPPIPSPTAGEDCDPGLLSGWGQYFNVFNHF